MSVHIPLVEIPGLQVLDGATVSVCPVYDGAGVAFEGYRTIRGNDTEILVRKVGLDGVELDRAYFDTPGLKADDLAIVQSGAHIDVYLVGHAVAGTRYYAPAKGRWENCATPYPAGHPALGADGAYIQGGTVPQPQGLSDADKTWINNQLSVASGNIITTIVSNMKAKAKAAIEEDAVLREATVHSSDGLYARIKETVDEVLRHYLHPLPPPSPPSPPN